MSTIVAQLRAARSRGLRLREERERLCLTQAAIGEAAGISRNAQINYESGSRHPDSEYLAALASLGVDVLYVLTGERSEPVQPSTLTQDEQQLLDLYRHSNKQSKAVLMAALSLASDTDNMA